MSSFLKGWDFEYPIMTIYTNYLTPSTNAIESLNMSLRKVTRNRGSFPNDESMLKLLYLALNNIAKKWTMPIRDWKAALNRFSILLDEAATRREKILK
jgi:transposase-like protein